jgi:hypothetical protein
MSATGQVGSVPGIPVPDLPLANITVPNINVSVQAEPADLPSWLALARHLESAGFHGLRAASMKEISGRIPGLSAADVGRTPFVLIGSVSADR